MLVPVLVLTMFRTYILGELLWPVKRPQASEFLKASLWLPANRATRVLVASLCFGPLFWLLHSPMIMPGLT